MASGVPHASAGVARVGQSLMEYLGKDVANVNDNLALLIWHLQASCKQIAALIASPSGASSINSSLNFHEASASKSSRDVPKPLDIITIIKSALRSSGKVAAIAAEEDENPVWFTNDGPYVVVFYPLDGSRNIDALIPTGTIFGVYRRLQELDDLSDEIEKASLNVMQRGSRLVAAGYVLYSSATILCISVGRGTQLLMLDSSIGEFVLVHADVSVSERGQIYSVNDARYFDWPGGLQKYNDDIRQGKGQSSKKYSARYICSLVADLHRTILYGGIAMNPRAHLQLVYEGNPLSFIVKKAEGKASDGKWRILDIQPQELHQRLPLFLGSSMDIVELESYGDVQQLVNPSYEV